MDKKLLILDLDETLIYGTMSPATSEADFEVGPYFIYKRPFLREFLKFCFNNFLVSVWTSSGEDYAKGVADNIFTGFGKLEFVWSCSRCVTKFDPEYFQHYYVKDLKKVKRLGYSLENIIMIDNTPRKLCRNYGNLVRVKSFEGDKNDDELASLVKYLVELGSVENVREIEKRGWKNRF